MKRKSLILVLVALFCLFFVGVNKVSAAEATATISFSDKANRTEYSTTIQVWEQNGVVVTNEKGSSTTNVGDYANPARFYKNSTIKVEYPAGKITQIVFNSPSGDCSTALNTSLAEYNPTKEEHVYTVILDGTSSEFSFVATGGQIRFNSVTVSYTTGEAGGETTEPEDTNEVKKVNELFTTYWNEGTYVKNTTIHLNATAVEELATHFHVENHLVRTTYYTPEALWMSQGAEAEGVAYSYYGSAANNGGVTYGVAVNPLEVPATTNVVLSGVGKESMEAYYTTLADLKSNTAVWVEDGNGYSTTDATVLGWFLDFTAPCLYSSVINSQYFTYAKASVEVDNEELVLKLWVNSTNYGYIEGGVKDTDNVLSTARISYEKPEPTIITTIADALAAEEGAAVELTGTVDGIYQAYNSSYNNVSVYISDATGRILSFRLTGNAKLHEIIRITGTVTLYNGTMQIAQGATFELLGKEECSEFSDATCANPAICVLCGEPKDDVLLDHDYVDGVCSECGAIDPDFEGDVSYPSVNDTLKLSFSNAANKASGDTYMKSNYPDWTITGKLGQTYGGYLGFGRSGDNKSAITSSRFTATSDFTLTTVLKGNGSSGVATSTVTFELLDENGNVIATGYAAGTTTAAIQPADGKDTTYTISFTYVDGKTYADAAQLRISFAKAKGNIGLKSLAVA